MPAVQALLLTDAARTAILALATYAVWTLLLLVVLVSTRGLIVLRDGHPITDFPASVPHGSERYWRLNRAHLNATENIGVVAALLLAGIFAGLDGWAFRTLPPVIAGARVLQSLVHLASGSAPAVMARVSLLSVQIISLLLIALELVRALVR